MLDLQGGAPGSQLSWFTTPITMVYGIPGRYIYILIMVHKPTYNWGGTTLYVFAMDIIDKFLAHWIGLGEKYDRTTIELVLKSSSGWWFGT